MKLYGSLDGQDVGAYVIYGHYSCLSSRHPVDTVLDTRKSFILFQNFRKRERKSGSFLRRCKHTFITLQDGASFPPGSSCSKQLRFWYNKRACKNHLCLVYRKLATARTILWNGIFLHYSIVLLFCQLQKSNVPTVCTSTI